MFNLYNHLGFHNPYYINTNNEIKLASTFEEALALRKNEKNVLDFTSLVQILSTGYCFGNRTLVKGINKSPWMAKLNSEETDWEYFSVPNHQENHADLRTIANTFINLLEQELLEYITDHKNIGILLTGGMDSRIVAAILHNLTKKGVIKDKNIFAYTWGKEDSRDIVYAKRIADLYGWSWKRLVVDELQMKENCKIAIDNGCEYTPIHLHAMSKVKNEKHLDCVLAGSFGDSVGRAEFSGVHVSEINKIDANIKNLGGFLRKDFYDLVKVDTTADLQLYYDLFPQEKDYQFFEQDQQIHYMRKMLNSCMAIIDQQIPLFQMFSSPNVFGYMWSLSPELRNDFIYKEVLTLIAPELLEIPWARTGLIYPNKEGNPDQYKRQHHDYGSMMRSDFMEYIENSIEKNSAIANKIFNVKNIKAHIKLIKLFPMEKKYLYEEKLLFIAQVLNFIDKYKIEIDLENDISKNINVIECTKYLGRFIKSK